MKKHSLIQVLGALGLLISVSTAKAQSVEAFKLYEQGNQETSVSSALQGVQAGDIVILGESHGNGIMPGQQLQVLQSLRDQGLKVSVGMEFFERQHQSHVDAMRSGALSEADFLKQIAWGSLPYSSYREQVNFPLYPQEFVVALNAPRTLTSRISKVGLTGLTDEEKSQLPSNFEVGNSAYYRRFQQAMGEHVPAEAVDRYFQAQSVWDDVMAYEATRFISEHPDQVLVIIVGEFHAQYGGGLPDRVLQRSGGSARIRTFSLINLEGLSQDEREQAVRPSPVDGPRADFVWTSQF